MATFSPSCRLVELAHFLVLVSLLRQEMRNPQWPGSLGLSEPAVERRWTVTERGEDLKQARQEGEACISALPLQFLITSSSDTGAQVHPGSYTMPSYGGAWRRYPFVPPPPIFKLENFVPGCWAWPAFSLKGKVFGGDVCVRLSRLLAVEPGDNEDYLTETNIDKWSTFLNSFQSTNFYFLSFSGAPRNL